MAVKESKNYYLRPTDVFITIQSSPQRNAAHHTHKRATAPTPHTFKKSHRARPHRLWRQEAECFVLYPSQKTVDRYIFAGQQNRKRPSTALAPTKLLYTTGWLSATLL